MKKKILITLGLLGGCGLFMSNANTPKYEETPTEETTSTNEIENIKKELEEAFANKLRDTTIFGVSIGTIVATCVALLPTVIRWKKDGEFRKIVQNATTNFANDVAEYKKDIKQDFETCKAYIQDQKDTLQQYAISFKEQSKLLITFKDQSQKLDTYMVAIKDYICTDKENIKSGIASRFTELVEEGLKYGGANTNTDTNN